MMSYIPERGDVVWLSLNPQKGHEQSGRRPAVVLSSHAYNAKVGLAIFCPITTQIKYYPFEVVIPQGQKTKGAILADQLRSLDWKVRQAIFIEKIPSRVLFDVIKKVNVLLTA